jgi:hypothetical protein
MKDETAFLQHSKIMLKHNYYIFTLFAGLFVPFANGRGVLCGTVVTLLLCSWLSLGGLANSPGILNQPSVNYRTSCNLSIGTPINGK